MTVAWAGVIAMAVAGAGEPSWTLDLGGGATPFVPDAPVVLAYVNGEVVGIDPEAGQVAWRRPQPDTPRRDLFRPVPGTPWVLLSTYVAGPDTFEVVDARTGETAWTAPEGREVLGVYAAPDGDALVVADRAEDPGHFSLTRIDPAAQRTVWTLEEALVAPPPMVEVYPPRGRAVTVRAAPGPLFVGDAVITAWSPREGVVRRQWSDGAPDWRLVVPGRPVRPPGPGGPDLAIHHDRLVVPTEQHLVAVGPGTGEASWRPGRGRLRAPIAHVVATEAALVAAGGDRVRAFAPATGRTAWTWRSEAPVADVAGGEATWVLDTAGTLVRLGDDGQPSWSVSVPDPAASGGLRLVGDHLVVVHDHGAVAFDPATGARVWAVGAAPTADLDGPTAFRSPVPTPRPGLYREGAEAGEHAWSTVDDRGRRTVHRVDLATGEHAALALDSARPVWVLEPRTGTVVEFAYGGETRGHSLDLP